MEVSGNTENETLKSLIKSCLLELNDLKLNLTEIEVKQFKDDTQGKIHNLEKLIVDKEKEVSLIKFKAEEEIKNLKSQLEEKDIQIKANENKIYELNYVNTSMEEVKDYFAKQLKSYKEIELADLSNRLSDAYKGLAEKDAQINALSKRLDESKIEIIKLENDVESQNMISNLERELEIKNKEIYEKDTALNIIKEKSVSKDDYYMLKEELVKKDNKIKRLEEINDFFNDLQEETQSFETQDERPPFKLDKFDQ